MNRLKSLAFVAAVAAAGLATLATDALAQAKEQFFPVLVYRTGAYAPNGVPFANGYVDYLKYVNAKGGMNGVKISFEECETGYATDKGVECYERLKGKGATVFQPLSTGITFALTEKAPGDKIPLKQYDYQSLAAPRSFDLTGEDVASVKVIELGYAEFVNERDMTSVAWSGSRFVAVGLGTGGGQVDRRTLTQRHDVLVGPCRDVGGQLVGAATGLLDEAGGLVGCGQACHFLLQTAGLVAEFEHGSGAFGGRAAEIDGVGDGVPEQKLADRVGDQHVDVSGRGRFVL